MQIEIFTFCDSAQVYAGKAVISGAFNQIIVKQLPLCISMTLAVRIAFEQNELGNKKLKFCIFGPDGKPIMSDFNVEATPGASTGKRDLLTTLDLNIGLTNLIFTQTGVYTIQMSIDGEMHSTKFLVLQE